MHIFRFSNNFSHSLTKRLAYQERGGERSSETRNPERRHNQAETARNNPERGVEGRKNLRPQDEAKEIARQEAEKRKTEVMWAKVRDAMDKLEKSDIGGELKQMLTDWLADNIKDKQAREVTLENIRLGGKDVKIGNLVEAVGDTYVSQHPEIRAKLRRDPSLLPALYGEIFDPVFGWALNKYRGKGQEKKLAEVNRVLERFKEILHGKRD